MQIDDGRDGGAAGLVVELLPGGSASDVPDRCALPRAAAAALGLKRGDWVVLHLSTEAGLAQVITRASIAPSLSASYGTVQGSRVYRRRDPSVTETVELMQPAVASASVTAIQPVPLRSVTVSLASTKLAGSVVEGCKTVTPILARELVGRVLAAGFRVETDESVHDTVSDNLGQVYGIVVPSTTVSVAQPSNPPLPESLPALSDSAPPAPAFTPPAGLESVYNQLFELVAGPTVHAALYAQLGTVPPRGLLLSGPPGVGKTWAVSRVAAACGAPLHVVNAADVLSAYPGETERNLRDAFAVAQLLTLLDGARGAESRAQLVVVGATNRPNAVDPAVRRPGRLDREVAMMPPPASVRLAVLERLTETIPLAREARAYLWTLAECLPGYVGADLAALVREACKARLSAGEGTEVTVADLVLAMQRVPPSLRRGHQVALAGGSGASTWADIGGLADVKEKLIQAVVWPLERGAQFARLGLRAPRGLLLYGPPGCSKTTLVRVLASELRSSFYTLAPADVYSALVGEAERIVRAAFHRARQTEPSVLFLDEIDALVGDRAVGGGGDEVKQRVLLTLLAEMDGIESHDHRPVLVVAATNHPDRLDAALVRAGRLDRAVYVRPPTRDERQAILGVFTRRMPLASDVDLGVWADKLGMATGADIEAICREAALASLREGAGAVSHAHFSAAAAAWYPTLTDEMVAYYSGLHARFRS
ncbi:hypothetical protein H9P43_010071 [Blastocladiella emersonii ATCC 22665]|nr:hypothetical protein H9P43_010071 [Blastocladiella emersonii ATCC 22665]